MKLLLDENGKNCFILFKDLRVETLERIVTEIFLRNRYDKVKTGKKRKIERID